MAAWWHEGYHRHLQHDGPWFEPTAQLGLLNLYVLSVCVLVSPVSKTCRSGEWETSNGL